MCGPPWLLLSLFTGTCSGGGREGGEVDKAIGMHRGIAGMQQFTVRIQAATSWFKHRDEPSDGSLGGGEIALLYVHVRGSLYVHVGGARINMFQGLFYELGQCAYTMSYAYQGTQAPYSAYDRLRCWCAGTRMHATYDVPKTYSNDSAVLVNTYHTAHAARQCSLCPRCLLCVNLWDANNALTMP